MNAVRCSVAAIALVALTSGCVPGQKSTSSSTPGTGTHTSPAASTATGACSQAGTNLEIVRLKGATTYYVRDITDILQPKTVAQFDGSTPQFASATVVSFVRGPTLLRMSLCGPPAVTTVAEPAHGLYQESYSWSPDGRSVAFVTNIDTATQVRVAADGQDRLIGSLPVLTPTNACVYLACAGESDFRLLYSPDGANVSLVQNLGGPSLRVWSSGGKVLVGSDSESNLMSAWSGSSLYFRDDKGVEVWHAGSQSLLLPGVAWVRPKASPAGGQIVFATRDDAGVGHIQILDTATGKTREIARSRSEPAFLNSHLIWYQEERPSTSAEAPTAGKAVPTGKTYIFDLQDNSESESLIASVYDVWPHPA